MSLVALLERDTFVLERPQGGVDSEGIPLVGFDEVGEYRGTWGTPRASERERAARAGEDIEAVCSCKFAVPLSVGAKLSSLRGENYIVVAVQPTVSHNRAFLRRL